MASSPNGGNNEVIEAEMAREGARNGLTESKIRQSEKLKFSFLNYRLVRDQVTGYDRARLRVLCDLAVPSVTQPRQQRL